MRLAPALFLLATAACSSSSAPVAVPDAGARDAGPAAACGVGQIYVYDQGCTAPTGHCATEITDAGLTVPPIFCGCDGVFFTDPTGAQRPYRSTGFCPVDPPPSDGGADAGSGVCCPITANEGCSGVNVSIGGWASAMNACQTTTWFDGYPMTLMTDEHGCPVLRENRAATQCGAPVLDAGAD